MTLATFRYLVLALPSLVHPSVHNDVVLNVIQILVPVSLTDDTGRDRVLIAWHDHEESLGRLSHAALAVHDCT